MSGPGMLFPKERIRELDVLRGLAILAVILQHALGVYIRKPDIQFADSVMLGILFNFTKFAVPSFVFLTGTTLFYNHYDKLHYGQFIKKRASEIILPYISWSVVYSIYYNGAALFHLAGLKQAARNIALGDAAYHLWYVVMIFQFYLLFPVLLGMFKQVHKRITTRLRFLSLLLSLACFYTLLMWLSSSWIPGHHPSFESGVLHKLLALRDRSFLFYFFYFILGGIASVAMPAWRRFVARSLSINGMIFITLFLWVGYELMKGASGGHVDLNYSTSLKPSMFFYTVSEILLLYGLSAAIVENRLALLSLIEFVGKLSFGTYLAHPLVLTYVVRGLARLTTSDHYLWMSALAFIMCAAGSVGVAFLIGRIPLGALLIGPSGYKNLRDQRKTTVNASVR
ncbi:MAG: acyltransferase [Candidatus Auribacterota bacterium]